MTLMQYAKDASCMSWTILVYLIHMFLRTTNDRFQSKSNVTLEYELEISKFLVKGRGKFLVYGDENDYKI